MEGQNFTAPVRGETSAAVRNGQPNLLSNFQVRPLLSRTAEQYDRKPYRFSLEIIRGEISTCT
jgi:hypothetical protein